MAKRCNGCMKLKENSPICEHCGYNENIPNYPHQLPIGTILDGRYVIGKVLGQGGFGITYIGWDQMQQTPVAIKEYFPKNVVTRECTKTLTVVGVGEQGKTQFDKGRIKFLKEARTLAKFSHFPEIVHIQRLLEENNTAYIVMEYLQGVNLEQYLTLKESALSVSETFEVLLPVFHALEEIHRAGLIHRDVSPDNIMICSDGNIKLMDFGTAREVENPEAGKDMPVSTEIVLKKGFAPFEQYRTRGDIGPWTDVYALCATMYYCLTAKIPNDATERIMGDDDVDWDRIPGLSQKQAAILKKGMACKSVDRVQSVTELLCGLFEEADEQVDELPPTVIQDTDVTEPPKKPPEEGPPEAPGGRWKKWLSMVGVVAAVVVAVVWTLSKREQAYIAIPETVAPQPTQAVHTTEILPLATEALVFVPEPTVSLTMPQETTVPKEVPAWANNVLMADPHFAEDADAFWTGQYRGFDYEINNYFSSRTVFGSDIPRSKISDVWFLDSLSTAPENAWDVSADSSESVLAWTVKNRKGTLNLIIAGEGGINGCLASRGLFYGFTNLTAVHFDGCFHTEDTEDFSDMFAYCRKLSGVDLSTLDTSRAMSLNGMFRGCSALTTLDLSGFDTSRVTDMGELFYDCKMLAKCDISGFDTSQVKNMRYMFRGLESIESLDVGHFNTSSLEDMCGMFYGCSSFHVKALDLSGFDTSSVTDMSYLFYDCNWLTDLDLSSFDTANVTDMQYAFYYCKRLTQLDLSLFDTGNVTNMRSMFEMCNQLASVKLDQFNTYKVIDFSRMFYRCGYLEEADTTKFDTSSMRKNDEMFTGCDRLPIAYKSMNGKRVW